MSASRNSQSPPLQSQGMDDVGDFGSKDSPSPSQTRGHTRRRRQHEKQKGSIQADTDPSQTYLDGRPSRSQPLPHTPPESSIAPYSFEDRRLSTAASSSGDFERGVTYRWNSEPSMADVTVSMAGPNQVSSPTFLQTSYGDLLPLDDMQAGTSMRTEGLEGHHSSAFSFSPSSYPSSNHILPIAPSESFEPRDSGVTGDMVSSDPHGNNELWGGHTRVYGGGICLACQAAKAAGGEDGGYYGENVPLDQRR
ncbi:hypothetical protein F5Y17DRAFT_165755 [Xylariaceae sp. FL0594]|nr:hypothetical protein F5Y17DRAFT_165755 [Xylariaceae sp. FL0594]